MTPGPRQPPHENEPKTGLSPWAIGGALCAAAAVWLFVELLGRVL